MKTRALVPNEANFATVFAQRVEPVAYTSCGMKPAIGYAVAAIMPRDSSRGMAGIFPQRQSAPSLDPFQRIIGVTHEPQ